MHPLETPRKSFVEQSLEKFEGPCVCLTDYMKAYADQILESSYPTPTKYWELTVTEDPTLVESLGNILK